MSTSSSLGVNAKSSLENSVLILDVVKSRTLAELRQKYRQRTQIKSVEIWKVKMTASTEGKQKDAKVKTTVKTVIL